nr:hypothetical protein Iba_chr12cCG12690 [Ipomoea batatas]
MEDQIVAEDHSGIVRHSSPGKEDPLACLERLITGLPNIIESSRMQKDVREKKLRGKFGRDPGGYFPTQSTGNDWIEDGMRRGISFTVKDLWSDHPGAVDYGP